MTPTAAGACTLRFVINGPEVQDEITLPACTVYPDLAAARSARSVSDTVTCGPLTGSPRAAGSSTGQGRTARALRAVGRGLQCGDVELAHAQHRLHRPVGPGGVGVVVWNGPCCLTWP